MKLIELFIPIANNNGEPFPFENFDKLKSTLADAFGGVTVYTKNPGTGIWKDGEMGMVKDQMIIYEVMAETLDKLYWLALKQNLMKTFSQKDILIRHSDIAVL